MRRSEMVGVAVESACNKESDVKTLGRREFTHIQMLVQNFLARDDSGRRVDLITGLRFSVAIGGAQMLSAESSLSTGSPSIGVCVASFLGWPADLCVVCAGRSIHPNEISRSVHRNSKVRQAWEVKLSASAIQVCLLPTSGRSRCTSMLYVHSSLKCPSRGSCNYSAVYYCSPNLASLALSFFLKLSTRPEKHLGSIDTWDAAEVSARRTLPRQLGPQSRERHFLWFSKLTSPSMPVMPSGDHFRGSQL
ncbi:hypothetical protein BJV78DRAFT_795598 [Lactifluus subvellereus]|nr:hypothetical protein BJV78DRAFT_795598 [Lactifluus subvellereus]